MSNWVIAVEGLSSLQEVESMRDEIRFNAVRAINETAAKFRTIGAERIRRQINFPSNYLNPGAKRFYVSRKATRSKLEAGIKARGRATSLARFVTGNAPGKEGVTVQVSKGKTQFLRRAFLVKLRAGSGNVDTKFNMGLAIRLKAGDKLRNKRYVRQMEKGLYLLYGPSVDQVFLAQGGPNPNRGVATDMEPDMLDHMEDEFLRLMEAKI